MAGCAQVAVTPVTLTTVPEPPEEIRRANEIWQKIEEREKIIKTDPNWISESYKGIKIRPLNTIPIERYADYNKFLDGGSVYIINHPEYYTFFHHPRIDRKNDSISKNIADLLIEEDNSSEGKSGNKGNKHPFRKEVLQSIKEFERVEKDFLEFKSTEKKLIILILPGNYKKSSNYSYGHGDDEYLRYINDVTNMSESVLYLESKKPNRGHLTDEDMNTLVDFLHRIGATSLMLGGEYVGRCQEDFYKQLSEALGSDMPIYIVPELSTPSPEDMNSNIKGLVGADGRLDIYAATYNLSNNKYEKMEFVPKIRNLKYRSAYEKPDGNIVKALKE